MMRRALPCSLAVVLLGCSDTKPANLPDARPREAAASEARVAEARAPEASVKEAGPREAAPKKEAGHDQSPLCPPTLPSYNTACTGSLKCSYLKDACPCGPIPIFWACTCNGSTWGCKETGYDCYPCPKKDGGSDAVLPSDAGCPAPLVFHPGKGTCVSTSSLHACCGPSCSASCQTGQVCVEYFGIAGKLQSCEIPCGPKPARLCPKGLTCADIADGPQDVCY